MAATAHTASSAGGTPISASARRAAMAAAFVAVVAAQVALVFPSPMNGLIREHFNASATQLSWVAAIFFLPTSVLELSFGILGETFGRKRLLVGGGIVLAVGDLIGALAPNIPTLLVGQVLAGIGAAAMFPASLSLIAHLTPAGRERAKGLSLWTMGLAVGASGGPLVAGWIGLSGSYRPAFAVVAALGLVSAIVSALFAVDTAVVRRRRLDLPGQITVAVALTALLYAVLQGSDEGYGSGTIIAAFVVGAVGLVLFAALELRSRAPMVELSIFKIPAVTGSALVALVAMCGFLGAIYTVSIRVAVIQGQNSLHAGLTTLILNIGSFLLWPLFARALHGVSPRLLMCGGLLLMAIGQFWFSQVPLSNTSLWGLTGPLILMGIAFNVVVATMSGATLAAVPASQLGVASGTTNLVRDFGQAMGVAIVGAIATAAATSKLGGVLPTLGLDPQSLGMSEGILHTDGSIGVMGAAGAPHSPLAPFAPKIIPAAQDALWHGYSLGLVWCGVFSLVAMVVAFATIRPATRVDADAPAVGGLATDVV